jgi:hypothetical protein
MKAIDELEGEDERQGENEAYHHPGVEAAE